MKTKRCKYCGDQLTGRSDSCQSTSSGYDVDCLLACINKQNEQIKCLQVQVQRLRDAK